MKISCGLVLIKDKKILLVHPTNSIGKSFSIPKGMINKDEDYITCAIRETKEEVGIEIKKKDIKLTKSSNIIARLFNEEEKRILKIIAENNELTQAKITSLAEMPRLKVFRIIEKLKDKDMIEKKGKGKIRIIKIKLLNKLIKKEAENRFFFCYW